MMLCFGTSIKRVVKTQLMRVRLMKEEGSEEFRGEGRWFYVTADGIHSKREAVSVIEYVKCYSVGHIVPAKNINTGKPFWEPPAYYSYSQQ